jgi:hypothetical protein
LRALEEGGGAPRTAGDLRGAGSRRRGRTRAGRWAAVTALASAVAATSLLVPVLIPVGRVAGTEPGAAGVGTAGDGSPAPALSPSVAVFQPIRIAATDPGNERYGVETITCPTCASGSRVQYVGQGHALVVHVRGIPSPGRRTLTIVYETNGGRPLDVIVNGAPTISLDLPGRDSWTTPASTRLPVDLPAGDTVIRLFHTSLPAPDLDQIVIS